MYNSYTVLFANYLYSDVKEWGKFINPFYVVLLLLQTEQKTPSAAATAEVTQQPVEWEHPDIKVRDFHILYIYTFAVVLLQVKESFFTK